MKQEQKSLLTKYLICFGVASLITFIVFWIKGFFTSDPGVNVQILADGFSVSGILLLLFAGMMYVSGEGALIGIGFIVRSVIQTFIPMGRKNHEFYAQYRERKMAELKKSGDHVVLICGLVFLLIGIIFTVIWYTKFYNMPV